MAEADDRDEVPTGNDGDKEEDTLGQSWAALRRLAGPQKPRPLYPEEETAREHPGELVIGTRKNPIVRIQKDGSVIYGDGYTPDLAAVELWTSIGKRRIDFDRRMQYLDLLELHIALLAVADAAYEAAQRATWASNGSDHERQREERSRASLEMRMHDLIEFAREFADRRPDLMAQARRMAHGVSVQAEPPAAEPVSTPSEAPEKPETD